MGYTFHLRVSSLGPKGLYHDFATAPGSFFKSTAALSLTPRQARFGTRWRCEIIKPGEFSCGC